MEEITKRKILTVIGEVYEKSAKCKLEKAFFSSISNELTYLSKYFNSTKIQSLFLANVFALTYKGYKVDLNELIDYFDCNPMKLLEFDSEFNALLSSGVLNKKKSSVRRSTEATSHYFIINEKVSKAIISNLPIPNVSTKSIETIYDILERIYNLGLERDDEEISTDELLTETVEIMASNSRIPLIDKINKLGLKSLDLHLYLYLIWKTITGNESSYVDRALEGIIDSASYRVDYMQKFISGDNTLIKNKLVEIVEGRFYTDTEMKLTDESIALLKEHAIKLFINGKKKENIISPEDIKERKLLFNDSEMEQLYLLKNLLSNEKLKQTQDRLLEKGLNTGIVALLHGAPGTGKTEFVKQITRETNRELMKVDISESKSMWFGESEKVVKRIFSDYKSFAKECEQTPILLFNEADAIFSVRQESPNSSSISQTQNAMQNILLEELENFEGILLATTNLANNLDSAFERRFLFKILFNKPGNTVRAKIWQTKIPTLSEKESLSLAEKFEFSGGQIENILRKNEIHEIIYGEKVSFSKLMTFCSEETIMNNRAKIGFV